VVLEQEEDETDKTYTRKEKTKIHPKEGLRETRKGLAGSIQGKNSNAANTRTQAPVLKKRT